MAGLFERQRLVQLLSDRGTSAAVAVVEALSDERVEQGFKAVAYYDDQRQTGRQISPGLLVHLLRSGLSPSDQPAKDGAQSKAAGLAAKRRRKWDDARAWATTQGFPESQCIAAASAFITLSADPEAKPTRELVAARIAGGGFWEAGQDDEPRVVELSEGRRRLPR